MYPCPIDCAMPPDQFPIYDFVLPKSEPTKGIMAVTSHSLTTYLFNI
jgi:hypothetical protein